MSPKIKEHRYRYHANLGTFLVHRWVRQGGDRSSIEESSNPRDEIAAAIEINPNAHFGREKYQLRVIDWIIKPPPRPTVSTCRIFSDGNPRRSRTWLIPRRQMTLFGAWRA